MSHSLARCLIAGIPPFFIGIGQNKGSESEAHTLRGYLPPRVLCDKPLACFCLIFSALLLFHTHSLTEAIRLSDKFKHMRFVREPVQERSVEVCSSLSKLNRKVLFFNRLSPLCDSKIMRRY